LQGLQGRIRTLDVAVTHELGGPAPASRVPSATVCHRYRPRAVVQAHNRLQRTTDARVDLSGHTAVMSSAMSTAGAGVGAPSLHNAFYLVDVLTLTESVTCITCAGEACGTAVDLWMRMGRGVRLASLPTHERAIPATSLTSTACALRGTQPHARHTHSLVDFPGTRMDSQMITFLWAHRRGRCTGTRCLLSAQRRERRSIAPRRP